MARAISVVSGKKGVGSSTVAINLAICIAGQGYRTCLLLTDPQFYENNLSVEIAPEKELTAVILKNRTLESVIITQYHGIDILLGGSMLETAQSIDPGQMQYFLRSFAAMADYDFFIIDALPGNFKVTLSLCMAATDIILVLTPESSSITSTHSLVKALGQNGFNGSMSVVVNQSKNVQISGMAINKLNDSLQKSFQIHLKSLGDITKDPLVSKSTDDPTPYVIKFPESTVSRDIQKIALTLTNMETSVPPIPGLAMFWEKFFNLLGADTKNFMAMAASIKPESRPSEFSPDENEVPAVGLKMLLTGDQRNRDDIKQTLSSGDFRALLVHLSDNIASLSREVGGLRIILERQSRRLSDSSDSPAHAPSKVSLDFESFLSQRLG
jgi:flagellar biosynthesis protein FlhG